MPERDVIVVGGGIWGLACAYACAGRGQSVTLYEAGRIGQGASAGLVGAMSPNVPEGWNAMKQFQFDALSSAENYWAKVDHFSGLTSGYGRIGRVMPIMTERDRVLCEERAENAKQLWQGNYQWDVYETHPLIPAKMAPFGITYDTLSARMTPRFAVASLIQACLQLGVVIVENHPVTALDSGLVSGAWGETRAGVIILAGGLDGFSLLDGHLVHAAGAGVKGQAALLDCDLGAAPQLFADGIYVIPHANGVVAVGSTTEKTWNHVQVDAGLETVIEKARKAFPALGNAPVIERWAGVRPKARRRYPMLGPVPSLQGVYCAMGAFTIGFGLAHKVGEVLADFAGGGIYDLPKNFTVKWHME